MEGSGDAGTKAAEDCRTPRRSATSESFGVRQSSAAFVASTRYLRAKSSVSTMVMRIASFGQACTQAGASPAISRSLHMSHLRTMPRGAEYFGTSYGHLRMQYWQPMH